jgi:hypothetical protein
MDRHAAHLIRVAYIDSSTLPWTARSGIQFRVTEAQLLAQPRLVVCSAGRNDSPSIDHAFVGTGQDDAT